MTAVQTGLYVDDGGEGGMPVVFVHSAAGATGHWGRQLEHLRASRRALAIDLRGHGRSAAPASPETTVEQFSEDIGAVADAHGLERFVLVGHSFGGAVAAAYAGRHPERVAGLLLLDPASDGRLIPPEQAEGFLQALRGDGYLEAVEAYWSPMLEDSTPEVRERVLGTLRSTARDTVYATLHSLLAFDPVSAIERYRGPKRSLITVFNEHEAAYHHRVKDLRHQRIEGVGHWLQLDAPGLVNAQLDDFLREVEGEGGVARRPAK